MILRSETVKKTRHELSASRYFAVRMTGVVDRRYPLDTIVARQLRDPNVRWGMGEAATVVFGFFGVLLVGAVIVVASGCPA